MKTFLFCFGFESPEEWVVNANEDSDLESSNGVWVEAPSKDEAVEAGREFAQSWVANLFAEASIDDFPGWRDSNYAYWIEKEPLKKWSGFALESMARIKASSRDAT